jgi:hypothetical protein
VKFRRSSSVWFLLAAVALAAAAGSGRAEDAKPWWDHGYDARVLPSAATPQWILVDPPVKSGMQIHDEIQDDGLSMTYLGTGVDHYYEITYSSPTPTPADPAPAVVWDGNSAEGNTVEMKVRVAQTSAGVPWTAVFGATGMGSNKDRSFLIYLNTQGITIGTHNIPVDLSSFRLIRFTRDPGGKIDIYVDGAPVQSLQVSDLTATEGAPSQLLFGGTYAASFQGVIKVASIHWTNQGVFKPIAP